MSRYQFPSAGTTTTDASLLVSGTLSDARLSSNVALENVANVFTAKQSFSGTTHVGLCLNSLTTAEYTALTPANGDLYRDSTTDRIDARLARGTVELVDTAGGQTIGGALGVTGNITLATGVVITSGSAGVGVLTINNDGNSRWVYNGAEFIVAGNIRPSTNNARTSGTSGQRWSTVFGVNGDFSGNLTASGTVATIATTINQASTTGLNPDVDNTANRPFRLQDAGTTWGYMAKWDANTRFQIGDFRVTGNACQLRSVGGTQPITVFGLTVANFSNVALLTVNSSTGNVISSPLASTISTGIASALTITPTYNQTGTAGSTDIQINRTETALGSGSHNFADFQVGGVSRFRVSNAGAVVIGSGTLVTSILSATATLDFPSIGSNDTETLTITVTGAVAGDSVFLGVPAGLDAGLIFCASVTAADTVTVRLHNSSGGSTDPASGTFRATVIRF